MLYCLIFFCFWRSCLNCSILGSRIESQNPYYSWDGRYCNMALICLWPLDTTEKWLETKHWDWWDWWNGLEMPTKRQQFQGFPAIPPDGVVWWVRSAASTQTFSWLILWWMLELGVGTSPCGLTWLYFSPHCALQNHIFSLLTVRPCWFSTRSNVKICLNVIHFNYRKIKQQKNKHQ